MTAKEMFEELGFVYTETPYHISYTYEIRDCSDDYWEIGICFKKDEKEIFSEIDITLDILKAINKQVEELGW